MKRTHYACTSVEATPDRCCSMVVMEAVSVDTGCIISPVEGVRSFPQKELVGVIFGLDESLSICSSRLFLR